MENSPTPKRVLFVALSGIGNYLMQSPAIAALKEAHPDWHVTVWVAPRGTKALAETDPNVDGVIEYPIKNNPIGHLRTMYKLRITNYNIAIVLSPGQLIKSAAYVFLAGIPKRIGNAYPLRGNPTSDFLLTDAIPEKEHLHDIEQNLRLLEPLRIKTNQLQFANYKLQIPSTDKKHAEEIWQTLHINPSKKIVGLHAGSAPDLIFKRWPLENFAEVAAELIKNHNTHILLFGGPDEEQQKQELMKLTKASLRGVEGIEAISVISVPLLTTAAIIQHCHMFLSNDSGLMHLAAAAGVKTYGLFGPTDEAKTGPRGKDSQVIRAPGTKPAYNTETNFELGTEPHPTITAITPQLVIDTISL